MRRRDPRFDVSAGDSGGGGNANDESLAPGTRVFFLSHDDSPRPPVAVDVEHLVGSRTCSIRAYMHSAAIREKKGETNLSHCDFALDFHFNSIPIMDIR